MEVNFTGILAQKFKSINSELIYLDPAIFARDARRNATNFGNTVGPLLRFGLEKKEILEF